MNINYHIYQLACCFFCRGGGGEEGGVLLKLRGAQGLRFKIWGLEQG